MKKNRYENIVEVDKQYDTIEKEKLNVENDSCSNTKKNTVMVAAVGVHPAVETSAEQSRIL